MSVENGEWIMHGLSRDDPRRLRQLCPDAPEKAVDALIG